MYVCYLRLGSKICVLKPIFRLHYIGSDTQGQTDMSLPVRFLLYTCYCHATVDRMYPCVILALVLHGFSNQVLSVCHVSYSGTQDLPARKSD